MKTVMNSRLLKNSLLTVAALAVLLGSSACSTQNVKSTTLTPIVQDQVSVPEDELLDVSVGIFAPGLDDIPKNREELTFADVRMAETQFTSYHLAQTLQDTGSWGVV